MAGHQHVSEREFCGKGGAECQLKACACPEAAVAIIGHLAKLPGPPEHNFINPRGGHASPHLVIPECCSCGSLWSMVITRQRAKFMQLAVDYTGNSCEKQPAKLVVRGASVTEVTHIIKLLEDSCADLYP